MLQPFDWKKLTPVSVAEHKFDGKQILFRDESSRPPAAIDALVKRESAVPCHWQWTGEGWLLRTNGAPMTAKRLHDSFVDMCKDIDTTEGVDYRILLTQSACEAAPSRTSPCGKDLRSPRTEVGYPARTGEDDYGDYARDLEDWAYHGGIHSSHGLTQCLIATAVSSRPDLFQGTQPAHYRDVLSDPRNAFECLAAYVKKARPEVQADPLAIRAFFAAGGCYPSQSSAFGARAYNDSIFVHWCSYWNDFAEVIG